MCRAGSGKVAVTRCPHCLGWAFYFGYWYDGCLVYAVETTSQQMHPCMVYAFMHSKLRVPYDKWIRIDSYMSVRFLYNVGKNNIMNMVIGVADIRLSFDNTLPKATMHR